MAVRHRCDCKPGRRRKRKDRLHELLHHRAPQERRPPGPHVHRRRVGRARRAGSSAVIDPSTEEPVAEIALGNAQDVAAAVAAARRAFATWSVSSAQSRASLLDRVHSLILERAELFAQAISLEMGAAIGFARGAQVPIAAEHIRVARDLAASYPFLTHRGDMAIMREAIGVCGLITPWNWPLYQITAKVGPALAAGCTVVLKPSELSPLSALLFAEVMHDAGVPPGVFNLVNGNGPEVGAALAAHPGRGHDLDHRLDPGRRAGGPGGRADGQARGAGTRRQIAQRDPAGCGLRTRRAGRGGGRHAQRRPVLQRADPHDRAARAPRGSRADRARSGIRASSWAIRVRRRPRTARWPIARSSIACRR